MDEDAPVLMGQLRVAWNNNNTATTTTIDTNNNNTYAPPNVLFPELFGCSVPPAQAINLNSIPGLDRDNSVWDVATLMNFRAPTLPQQQQQQQQGGGGAPKRSARDALSALVTSGRLPGVSSPRAVPSPVDIANALNRFAAEVGASEEEAAALRSTHFLHLLGFQRLEQLRGNMHAFGVGTAAQQQQQPQQVADSTTAAVQMFSQEPATSTTTKDVAATEKWVAQKTQLYDAVLKLVLGEDKNNNKQSPGAAVANPPALWSAPPAKLSEGTQTQVFQESIGTMNPAKAEGVRHPAEKTIKLVVPSRLLAKSERGGWSIRASLLGGADDNNSNAIVAITLSAPRVVFGRIASSRGEIRARSPLKLATAAAAAAAAEDDDDGEQEQKTRDEQQQQLAQPQEPLEEKAYLPDSFHVDIAAVLRYLSRGQDSGTHISREHFVLSRKSSGGNNGGSLELLPCGRNMLRVNGDVVYAAPRLVKPGDKIVVGSKLQLTVVDA